MMYEEKEITPVALYAMVTLRILIGWHFLYEGISKLLNPYWSSAGYLAESKWIFSGIFKAIAENSFLLNITDIINIWGLIFIGTALIAGIFTKIAGISGCMLLLLYYFCAPPFVGLEYSMPSEGNYLIVNKILIEASALFLISLFPTGKYLGLELLYIRFQKSKSE